MHLAQKAVEAPTNHPEISSRKLADFECRFPYFDSHGRDRAPFWPFLRTMIFGHHPATPCSPGPFVLLLTDVTSKRLASPVCRNEKCGGDFCCVDFGGYCQGFSWTIFLGTPLSFLSLFFFLNSLFFLFFFCVFAFFSRDFRGSVGIKHTFFFVVFLSFFPKNREGQGFSPQKCGGGGGGKSSHVGERQSIAQKGVRASGGKMQLEWQKCFKNQCSRSRAVSRWVWTPFCVILWGWLNGDKSAKKSGGSEIKIREKFFPPKTQWARRDRLMSRGKNCRETIFVSHLSRN